MTHVPMTLPELMISQQYHPFSATCSYVELDDGRIFHASKGARRYSQDGGLTWSAVQPMVHADGRRLDCAGSCLTRLPGHNAILLVSMRRNLPPPQVRYATRKVVSSLWSWRSSDGGETWSEPEPVTPPEEPVWCMTDTLVRLSSGRIIMPVFTIVGQYRAVGDPPAPRAVRLLFNQAVSVGGHHYEPTFGYAFVVYSDDEGVTWHRNDDGELFILRDWSGLCSYVNEASLAEVGPGRLLVFFRTVLGRLFQAWSDDNGQTWTRPQPTVLASTTATPTLRRLPNGHLLAVWNQDSAEDIRAGAKQHRLSSAISRDGGRVWEFFQNVDSEVEGSRVEPGPIRPTRPEELYFPAGQPAIERDPAIVRDHTAATMVKSPSLLVMKDRVLISYPRSRLAEHLTEGRLMSVSDGGFTEPESGKPICQVLKILPLKWFYGGKEPADNPYLVNPYAPAKP